jgi:cellulose synthase/poly-beta-1,6-N-acetylglucosamine synthase-like glycosyltransferase/peptidoglycan/xylan/chitin deacetylase (PgdA/CDA1 family)
MHRSSGTKTERNSVPEIGPNGGWQESPKKRRGRRLPIFLDPGHRRLHWVEALAIVGFGLMITWFSLFALTIYYVEKMPGSAILRSSALPGSYSHDPLAEPAIGKTPESETAWQNCGVPGQTSARNPAAPKVYAFFPGQSDLAEYSLGNDCGAIDTLLVGWYELDTEKGVILAPDVKAGDGKALLGKLRDGAVLLPVLAISELEPSAAQSKRLANAIIRNQLADTVAALVTDNNYEGLCVEFNDPALAGLFADIGRKLAALGRQTCLITAAQGTIWHMEKIVKSADLLILKMFNDTPQGSAPAPLAAQAWFERIVGEAVAKIGAERLVVALGNFGGDWTAGETQSELISYSEAMRRAARHPSRIEFSADALNTTINWRDVQGRQHRIWLLDSVSLRNQRTVLAHYPLAGMALWPLGFEDPASWRAMALEPSEQMQSISLDNYVGYEGNGAFMQVVQAPQSGHRDLATDPATGLIRQQTYTKIPRPYTIRRFGAGADNMIVLTFDDGPDDTYTSEILDILKARRVPATFFLIGKNVLKAPGIAQRMIAEGHEIGSHTFFHPNIEFISELREKLELNTLQRLIVSITGHSTMLFRSPYGRGSGPLTSAEAQPLQLLDQSGYLVAGGNVIPTDWLNSKPDAIVASAIAQLAPTGGNVIVLHDGGGDRSATVAALPLLIAELQAKGYRFATFAAMLGLESKALMPQERGALVTLDRYTFSMIGSVGTVLQRVFWAAIILGVLRSFVLLILALMPRPRKTDLARYTPAVTVVIPAYNEKNVILTSIQTVLASDYPDLRLIVIDDGSQDETYEKTVAAYGENPRVTILHEVNQGKWMALDSAFSRIETEIVVALDADTVLLPDAIGKLVLGFRDPDVGAVAGKVHVGNRDRLLTKLQALEYTVAQNIDRRAAEMFNGIMVVPGAIGAWRVAAVRKAGLYTNETLAEDADLTVSILRAGYRVVFAPDAVSITEAPATLRGFMKQRLRWTLGMMQTAWKHRRAAREGLAVGWISIPDLWLFGVFMALLAPIADLVFLGVVVDAAVDAALGRPVLQSPASLSIIAGYLALPAFDILAALLAFAFERKAPWLVLLIPLQRLVYRPLLYITVYRATWRAITGRLATWGKPARLGTVRAPRV